ncbi:MAG: hypothetical protein NC347_03970 [Clostridium sp.]|nr:hypothetical protein [Clostridium sp.]
MDISDITMFITKMNEAFGLIIESFREIAEALNKSFECFGENEEEEKNSVSSIKRCGIFLKDTHQIYTQSLYKPHRSYKFRGIWHIKEDITRADFAHFYI